MHLCGIDIPGNQALSAPGDRCRYLGYRGCRLPRDARPWVCTWYVCPTQAARLRGVPVAYRETFEQTVVRVKQQRAWPWKRPSFALRPESFGTAGPEMRHWRKGKGGWARYKNGEPVPKTDSPSIGLDRPLDCRFIPTTEAWRRSFAGLGFLAPLDPVTFSEFAGLDEISTGKVVLF